MKDNPLRPLSVLIAALGGQGGGVLAQWLVEAAIGAGFPAQGTSIPGVAQRTGATTYYVEIYPARLAALDGRAPILGLYPVPGSVDLLVASELLEAARMVQAGMASPEETLLIASTSRTLTTVEKMAPGDARLDSGKLLEVLATQCRRLVAFDMDAAAQEAGTVVSAVMAGVIAGSGMLPFAPESVAAAIRDSGVSVEASLGGFERGRAAATATPSPARRTHPDAHEEQTAGPGARAHGAALPPGAREIATLGVERLVEFQDEAYAELYLQRVRRILAAERAADPDAAHGHAVTREAARYLALWMAFDDVVRVADLKSRASRFARVRREVGAQPGDVVRVVDYLKPGMPEVAGLLPARLARALVAWDRRRQQRGAAPLAWPLRLRADSASGFLALRIIAALKRLRVRGARYGEEQALIERWLAAIESAARVDWRIAHELALCGRLIKGYGATNERGKRNLMHIVEQLAGGAGFAPSERAEAIRSAREAALADEGGAALDATLVRLGAPPRPAPARPVVFVRRKSASAARVR